MGIQDTDIMNILFLIYILQYDKKDNIKFDYYKEMQQQIIKDLSTYSNLILALTRLKQEIDTNIQNNNLSNQHSQLNKLDSFEVINNYKNFGSDKYFVICDSIIGDV